MFDAGLNFFAYAKNNPPTLADPKGLYTWQDVKPAWDHYCSGTGTPWTTNFNSINWGDTSERVFGMIKSMVGGTCSDRTIPVNFSMGAQTAGADAMIIGRHVVKVQGTIKVNCDCTWTFLGDMSSKLGYDPYDFDPSNRGIAGETATWIGAHRCPKKGKPFNIYLPGSDAMAANGHIEGKSTCKCKK